MEAFEIMLPSIFKSEMIQHLANEFPELSNFLGEEGLLEIIENGIQQGKTYGLKTKYQYCVFIDSTVVLGKGFDTDVQLAWVQEILKETSDKTSLIDNLDDSVIKYQENILGGSIFPESICRFIKSTPFDDLYEILAQSSSDKFQKSLELCWPEKYSTIEDSAITRLFDVGFKKAKKYNTSMQLGSNYFTLLMFFLGQDFDTDPKYNWLISILNDPTYDEEYYKLSSVHFTLQRLFEAISKEVVSKNQ